LNRRIETQRGTDFGRIAAGTAASPRFIQFVRLSDTHAPRVHVYLKERDVPHIWNVDDEGHTPKTWASNLYHFAQRIFR
jgi:hypothetical protein